MPQQGRRANLMNANAQTPAVHQLDTRQVIVATHEAVGDVGGPATEPQL